MEINYCPNCGSKLNDDAKFCHKCGEDLSIFNIPKIENKSTKTPIKEVTNEEHKKPQIEDTSIKCPYCGLINQSDSHSCKCGYKFYVDDADFKSLLPEEMTCPKCKTKLILEDSERESFEFICPECERTIKIDNINNTTSTHDKNSSGFSGKIDYRDFIVSRSLIVFILAFAFAIATRGWPQSFMGFLLTLEYMGGSLIPGVTLGGIIGLIYFAIKKREEVAMKIFFYTIIFAYIFVLLGRMKPDFIK